MSGITEQSEKVYHICDKCNGEVTMKNPMYLCRKFEDCNVPVCPLNTSEDGIRIKGETDKCSITQRWRNRYRRDAQK